MKKFLDNIIHSKLGKILDHLFLGFKFYLPKFVLYLIIPTVIFLPLGFIIETYLFDAIMKTLTLSILPIFLLGAFWFIYRTTRLD